MPRTKLQAAFAPKIPPIDWLWAAVLERKAVMGYDLKEMSEIAGCSYANMRRLIKQSPWNWPRAQRERVCDALGLTITLTPEGMKLEGSAWNA